MTYSEDEVRDLTAQAWDDGWNAGYNDRFMAPEERTKNAKNPYRKEQA